MKTIMLFIAFGCAIAPAYCQQGDEEKMNYNLAKQYLSEGKEDAAVKILEELSEKHFQQKYYDMLMTLYSENKSVKKQEKLIKKAIKLSDGKYNYIIDLGDFYTNNSQQSKGIKQYDNVISSLKANNSEVIQTANCFVSHRNYDYAVKTYLQARKLFRNPTAYTYELSYIYQTLGRNDEIIKEYINLLDANPELLNQAEVNINNLMNADKDDNLYRTAHDYVLEKTKKNPNNRQYSQLYYWLLLQKNNFAEAFIQAKAIDKRFYADENRYVSDFAYCSQNAGQYKYAVEAYDYILKHNKDEQTLNQAMQNRLSCLYNQYISQPQPTSKQTEYLDNEYKKAFSTLGYTLQSVPIMKQYAELQAYHLDRPQQAVDLLDSIIQMRNVPKQIQAECKTERADIFLMNGDVWEASLTYSQVSKDMKNEVIGSVAKFRNAMLSYYTGDFDWAYSQFNTLRASTTKLIANDAMEYSLLIKENVDPDSSYIGLKLYAQADFALYRHNYKQATEYLDSIEKMFYYHPLFDEILYKRAQIAIKLEQYSVADSLLEDIITKYPNDLMADDALMLLAWLNEEKKSDRKKAEYYYEKLILDYPSSLYVPQARKKYNEYEKNEH
ncbi:MAG: tetratricopeptide repeat protein [Bacteroidales bacterium]|nr:tetratricopeptide repeat protein [Bacteroidales bacterium]